MNTPSVTINIPSSYDIDDKPQSHIIYALSVIIRQFAEKGIMSTPEPGLTRSIRDQSGCVIGSITWNA